MAFPTGWKYKHKITINHTPAAALVNFPVLITQEHLDPKVFTTAQATGNDLRFTLDKAGLNILAHEIEVFGSSNTKIHVKVPLISPAGGDPDWLIDANGAMFYGVDGDSFVLSAHDPVTKYHGVMRNQLFAGDQSWELDWDFLASPNAGVVRNFQFQVNIGDAIGQVASYFYVSVRRDPTLGTRINAWDASNHWVTTALGTSGTIKITRSGSTFKVFYWNPTLSQWEWNGSTAGYTVTSVATAANCWYQLWQGQTGEHLLQLKTTAREGGAVVPAAISHYQPGLPVDEIYVWYGNSSYSTGFSPFKFLDPRRWELTVNTAGDRNYWTVDQVAHQVSYSSTVSGADYWSGMAKQHQFAGDFDFWLEYDFTGSTTPSGSNAHALRLRVKDAAGTAVAIDALLSTTNNTYFEAIGSTTTQVLANLGLTGRIRLARTGSAFKVWYWKNSAWEWNGDANGLTVTTTVTTAAVTLDCAVKQFNGVKLNCTFRGYCFAVLYPMAGSSPWDDQYIAVYHLNETGNGTAGEYKDATNHNLHAKGVSNGTIVPPTRVSSSWSYGQQMTSTTKQAMELPGGAAFYPRYTLTEEFLHKPTTFNTYAMAFTSNSTDYAFAYTDNPGNKFTIGAGGWGRTSSSTIAAFVLGQYCHVASVFDLSQATEAAKARLVVNGSEIELTTAYGTPPSQFHTGTPPTDYLCLGCDRTRSINLWNGTMDEVRFSSVARSTAWLSATYQTLFNAAAFAAQASAHYGIYGEGFHYVASPNHADALGYPFQGNGYFDQVLYHVGCTNGANFTLRSGYGDTAEVEQQMTFTSRSATTTQAMRTLDFCSYSSDHFQRVYLAADSGNTFSGALIMTVPQSDQAALMNNFTYGGVAATAFGSRASLIHALPTRSGVTLLAMYVSTTGYLYAAAIGGAGSDNPTTVFDSAKQIYNLGGTDFYPVAYACGDQLGAVVVMDNNGLEFRDFKGPIGTAMTAGMTMTTLNSNGWRPKSKQNIAVAASQAHPFKFLFFRDSAATNTLRYCVHDAGNNLITAGDVTTAMVAGDYGFCATYDHGHWRKYERCWVYYIKSDGHLYCRMLQVVNAPADGKDYFGDWWWETGGGFSIGTEVLLTDLPIALKANNIQAAKRSFRQNGVVFQTISGDLFLLRHLIPVSAPGIGADSVHRLIPDSEGWMTQTAYSPPQTFGDKTLVVWNAQCCSYANIWDHTLSQWLYPVKKRISLYYDDDHNVPLVRIGNDGRIWTLMGGRQGSVSEDLKIYRSHKLISDVDISDLLDFSQWSYLGSPYGPSRGYKGFSVDNHGGCLVLNYSALHSYNIVSYRDGAFRSSSYASVLYDKLYVGNSSNVGYPGMPMGRDGHEEYPARRSYHLAIPFANYSVDHMFRCTELAYLKLVADPSGKVRGYRADGSESVLPIAQTIASGAATFNDLFADADIVYGSYQQVAWLKAAWTANQSGITLGANRVHNDQVWTCVNIGEQVDTFAGPGIDGDLWDQTGAGYQSVANNTAVFDFPANGSELSTITTKATRSGDFELIVTYAIGTYLTEPSDRHEAALRVTDGSNWVEIARTYQKSAIHVHAYRVMTNTGQTVYFNASGSGNKMDIPLKSRMRIKRTGGAIAVSVYSCSDVCKMWEWNQSATPLTVDLSWSGDFKIELRAKQGNTPFSVAFSDLYLVSSASYTCGAVAPFPANPGYRQRVTDNQVVWQYRCRNFDRNISQGGEATPVAFRNSNKVRIGSMISDNGGVSATGLLTCLFDGSQWYVVEEGYSVSADAYYYNSTVSPSELMSTLSPWSGGVSLIPSVSKSIDYGLNWKSEELMYDATAAEMRGSVYTVATSYAFGSTGTVLWALNVTTVGFACFGEYGMDWGIMFNRSVFSEQFQGYFVGV